ncbi:hypothetical protein FAI40_03455 [Acetobacteraceae bacterium]|nr:hypothetical protein FAI40_03455 [Acetobacteraceae bacterium]
MTLLTKESKFSTFCALVAKYFWVNLFYILPASFVFSIPNFFGTMHRFLIDCILPFCFGNLFSLCWEFLRRRRRKRLTGELNFCVSKSGFANNLYYIFPVCLMNASIALFEICLLSGEEWREGHFGENILYLFWLFFLFLGVNCGLGSFCSWLVRCGASDVWRLIKHRKRQPCHESSLREGETMFGGFPLVSFRQRLFKISHPKKFFGRLYWHFLLLNVMLFLPAAIGMGLCWLEEAPDLVWSRYFVPIVLILLLYINFLAVIGGFFWFLVRSVWEENAPNAFRKTLSQGWSAFLYALLRANLIGVLPFLCLAKLGQHLPESLAFLDPFRQSIRILPPKLWLDFLGANFVLIPVIFGEIACHFLKKRFCKEAAAEGQIKQILWEQKE